MIAEHVGISPYRPQLALALLVAAGHGPGAGCSGSPGRRCCSGLLVLAGGLLPQPRRRRRPGHLPGAAVRAQPRPALFRCRARPAAVHRRRSCRSPRRPCWSLAALAGLTVVHQFVLHNDGRPVRSQPGTAGAGGWCRHCPARRHVVRRQLLGPVADSGGTAWPVPRWLAAARRPVRSALSGPAAPPSLAARGLPHPVARRLHRPVPGRWSSGSSWPGAATAARCWLVPVVLAVLVPLSGIGSRLGTLSAHHGGVRRPTPIRRCVDPETTPAGRAADVRRTARSPGHGIGSYARISSRATTGCPTTTTPVDIVVAAHNFYLEQAADGGVLLLLAWSVFIGTDPVQRRRGPAAIAVRARRPRPSVPGRRRDRRPGRLARGQRLPAPVRLPGPVGDRCHRCGCRPPGATYGGFLHESDTSTVAADRRPPTRVARWGL